MIVETFAVGALGCNCTILADPASGDAIVIDGGDEEAEIARRLAAHGVRPRYLVHTHAHVDHIGALGPLRERVGGDGAAAPRGPAAVPHARAASAVSRHARYAASRRARRRPHRRRRAARRARSRCAASTRRATRRDRRPSRSTTPAARCCSRAIRFQRRGRALGPGRHVAGRHRRLDPAQAARPRRRERRRPGTRTGDHDRPRTAHESVPFLSLHPQGTHRPRPYAATIC